MATRKLWGTVGMNKVKFIGISIARTCSLRQHIDSYIQHYHNVYQQS